jgi:Pro-kumamolisin, activation domain/IPT/TIG domain
MKRLLPVVAAACTALLSVVGLASASATPAAQAAVGSPSTTAVTAAPSIPAGDKAIGLVPASAVQSAMVVLRPADEGEIQPFIANVTNPSSPLFHHYLAPGQYGEEFGPTEATIDGVTSSLRAEGLRVTNMASDGLFVSVTGTTARMEQAFGTKLERYRLSDGSIGQATTSAVRLPTSIAGSVVAVIGLNSVARVQSVGMISGSESSGSHAAANAASFPHPDGSAKPCAAATATAEKYGGLTDDQIGNAYGAFGLYGAGDLGAGQHIGIYELEPFLLSDVKTFDTCYFGATGATQMLKRLTVVPVDGGVPAGPGSGEAALDVDDVSALAPEANIDVYEGPGPGADGVSYDPVDEYVPMVNRDVDQVISSSWGLCEQAVQSGQPGLQAAENLLFEQAAAQGQSVFAAAGDNGSDDCNSFETSTAVAGQNPVSVDDPGSQPDVVSVGGTTIDDATQPPLEHVWNDGANGGGGGGGISMSWEMPAWQLDSHVPGIVRPGSAAYVQADKVEKQFGYPANFCQAYLSGATSSTPCRTVPDVSAQADEYTGAITIVYDGSWYTIGGTSSATPIWASMLAEVNASPTCQANTQTKSGVGFVSPLLYAVASNPAAYKASFNDITAGNNDIYDLDNGQVFGAGTGYDPASGLGSPQLTAPGAKAGLAYYLCSLAGASTRPAVSGLSPTVLPTTGGRVTITGTGFESAGKPDVADVQVGAWRTPIADFTVESKTTITATFPPAAKTLAPDAPKPQDGAGPAEVIVSLTNDQASAPGPASTLQYADEKSSSVVPSVTGISPYGGSETSPKPVTILGSGFNGATGVTFGGVAASSFKVLSSYAITATPPAYSNATTCAPLPTSGVYAGENATNDICQVPVQVTNASGSSVLGRILPPYEGTITYNPMAVWAPPPGCGCETAPVPTEYDYAQAPSISSVSTSAARPSSLASETGGTVITITGKGFDPLSIVAALLGDPTQESSEDVNYVSVTGTQLQIQASAQAMSVGPQSIPLQVWSLAGLSSGSSSVVYAGVPTVSVALNTARGRNGAADTGGAPVSISGQGFDQAIGPLMFSDSKVPSIFATQYSYAVPSDSRITTESPQSNPGLDDVEVCSVTACSLNPPADYFYLYPPGNPKVDSVSPSSGPAGGGTRVEIRGENLGCVTGVFFGTTVVKTFSNAQAILDCGSTELVDAMSPPGKAGSKVNVTVTTVESNYTGSGRSISTAYFTYK